MNHSPIPDIVETIKERHIAPTPRWVIIGKRLLFWALLALFGGIAAIFLSLALVDLLDLGPDLFRSLGIRRFPFLLFLGTPLLWSVLFAAAILLGLFTFHKTKRGYRFRALFVASLLALIAVSFTFIAHRIRLDDRLDCAIENGTPEAFRKMLSPREARWMSPRDGVLAGKILEARDASFTLETSQREVWSIILTDTTKKGRFVLIERGFPVIVIGTPKETRVFEALFIRPLRNRKTNEEKTRANFFEALPYNTMRGAHDTVIYKKHL